MVLNYFFFFLRDENGFELTRLNGLVLALGLLGSVFHGDKLLTVRFGWFKEE